MAIKLVALDIDGTLIPEGGSISRRTFEVIRKVQQAGVMVILATGRAYPSAQAIAEALGIEGPLITYGGALIRDARSQEILFESRLPASKAAKAFGLLQPYNMHINVHLPEGVYAERHRAEVDLYHSITSTRLILVGDLNPYLMLHPYKLTAISSQRELLNQAELQLRENLGSECNIASSLPQFLEILDTAASKSKALEHLCPLLHIAADEIMAIGDGFNDAEMISFAGLGVAMGNAPDELKALADFVTANAHEDGVALALEAHILQ